MIRPASAPRRRVMACLVGAAASMGVFAPLRAQPVTSEPVRVELISENLGLIPGQPTQLGVRLRHAPHWHTCWVNPGDIGVPTTLVWSLPAGFRSEGIGWPLPQRFEVGGQYSFGYGGELVLPILLDVPASARPGTTAHLAVLAHWLACREECMPGRAELTLDLPIARGDAKPDPRWRQLFTRAELAQPEATAWSGTARLVGARVEITLRGPGLPPAAGLDAFAVQRRVLDNRPPTLRRVDDALVIDAGKSESFASAPAALDLVLTSAGGVGPRGWNVRVPWTGAAQAETRP